MFLNKKLHIFGVSETPLDSFCHKKEETTFHISFECCKTHSLWEELRKYFHDDFPLPILSPQTALFGYLDFSEHEGLFLFNHVLLVFKLYLYKTREEKTVQFKMLLMNVGGGGGRGVVGGKRVVINFVSNLKSITLFYFHWLIYVCYLNIFICG